MNVAKISSMVADLASVASTGKNISKIASSTSDAAVGIANTAAKKIDNISDAVQGLTKTVSGAKDTFINSKAESDIKKLIGDVPSVESAKEKFRQDLIDSKFSNVSSLMTRIKNNFFPSEFPSGTKFKLKKTDLNTIAKNAEKGKDTMLHYTKNNGDEITVYASKMVKKQGEDCFRTQVVRKFGQGASESIELRYYPKSSEIRTIGKTTDGHKVFSSIMGDEAGGKVKLVGSKLDSKI